MANNAAFLKICGIFEMKNGLLVNGISTKIAFCGIFLPHCGIFETDLPQPKPLCHRRFGAFAAFWQKFFIFSNRV